MSATPILLRALSFQGSLKPPANVTFGYGLNVICGASDTGKSFVAEALDYMLGGSEPLRDIPERTGYEKALLTIEIIKQKKQYRLERSTSGGDFNRFQIDEASSAPTSLHARHSQNRDDTLSAWLLNLIGLSGRRIKTKQSGTQRSLSFRDIARLVILQQGEISSKTSPYLSGQYVTKTAEYSALKLLLTGTDDASIIAKTKPALEPDMSAAKIELIDSLIEGLRAEVENAGATAPELAEQLESLQQTLSASNNALRQAQEKLGNRMKDRRELYQRLAQINGRLDEIRNLVGRFDLLEKHYQVDLQRLAAISEAGEFISHLPNTACPLCGAEPEHQHTASNCDGNIVGVSEAAKAEQNKIRHLLTELGATVNDLKTESMQLNDVLYQVQSDALQIDRDIQETLSPSVGELRAGYVEVVEKTSQVRRLLELFQRIGDLEQRKKSLSPSKASPPDTPQTEDAVDISKSILNELSKIVEKILIAWNFPGAGRVYFDERSCDFVCDGKPRASFGAGFRAIISAAASVGLLEYCLKNNRPHPGFVVLESPLLAYWKPEGSSDDLKGTDLKDRFYDYLAEKHQTHQIVVIENEHPPTSLDLNGRLTVFTRNPVEGRYGFFPQS